jgi:DNA invertase Pin-like site-specific DNA recombinase
MAGLAAARAKGRIGGKQRIIPPEKFEEAKLMIANGAKVSEAAKAIGFKYHTLSKYLREDQPDGAFDLEDSTDV